MKTTKNTRFWTAIAFFAGAAFSPSIVHAEAADSDQPNIILILTDDQGYGDFGAHGHPFVRTPNMDRIHSESARFTDFHVSPTCAPTRAALMTGRSAFHNGVTHTILERERMNLKATTIAEVLQDAGYATGIFGKWHLGEEDPYQPENRGFDEVFIHAAGGIGQNWPGAQGDVPGNGYFDPIIRHNNQFVRTKGYCTDVFFQQALGWMRDVEDQPFFAYIATNAPHAPFIVADHYREMYEDECADRSARFYGMITNIDDNVGLLMEKLEQWDLSEDTLLIFMTDNGTSAGTWNAEMRGRKTSLHEGGSRAALFLRWPGRIEPGRDIDRLARHYDLFPTLAEIAGAEMPGEIGLSGRSLLTLIDDPEAAWPDRYTFFHVGRWGKSGAEDWDDGHCSPDLAKYEDYAVRSERWRLVNLHVGKDALYDIENDPGEKQDVIEENQDVALEMKRAYDEWWAEVRPLFVNEDASLDVRKPFAEEFEKQQSTTEIPDWESSFEQWL